MNWVEGEGAKHSENNREQGSEQSGEQAGHNRTRGRHQTMGWRDMMYRAQDQT